jgi:hypothetical protein
VEFIPTSHPEGAAVKVRDTHPSLDGPFCWQSEAAFKRIEDNCGPSLDSEEDGRKRCILVYVALTRIASKHRSPTFTASLPEVALHCGLCTSTVSDTAKELAAAGVISLSQPRLRSAATFSLLACRSELDSQRSEPDSERSELGSERSEHQGGATVPNSIRRREEGEEYFAGEDGGEKEASPKLTKAERDALFDAVCRACGDDAEEAKRRPQRIGKALKDIFAMTPDVTPADISRRAGAYRRTYPRAKLTPEALAKHWPSCSGGGAKTHYLNPPLALGA